MTGQTTIIYRPEAEKESSNTNHSHCLRCGRKLINEEYKKIGYGPVCYKKIQVYKKLRLF